MAQPLTKLSYELPSLRRRDETPFVERAGGGVDDSIEISSRRTTHRGKRTPVDRGPCDLIWTSCIARSASDPHPRNATLQPEGIENPGGIIAGFVHDGVHQHAYTARRVTRSTP